MSPQIASSIAERNAAAESPRTVTAGHQAIHHPYSEEPLYSQLAGILRRKVQSGELGHLDPLPSETTLCQEYGISRDTARRAVQALRDEGVVFTVPHRGTYVGPRPA